MAKWTDAVIVTLISMGAAVLLGIVGYLIEKSADSAERKPEGNQNGR